MGLFFTAQNMIADLRERKDRDLETQRNSALTNAAYKERNVVSNFLETNRTPQLSSGPSSISHAVQAMEEEKTNPSPSFFSMGDTNWGSDSRKQDFKNLLLDIGNQFSTKENPIDPDTLDTYFKNSQATTYMDGQDVVYQGNNFGSQVQISEVLDGTVPSKDAARKIYLQNTVDEAVKTSDESFMAYKLLEESTFSPEEGRHWSVEDFLRLNEDGSKEGTRILGEIVYNIVDLVALGFSGANVDPGMTGLVGSMVIQTPKVQQMFLDIAEGLLSVISSEELKGFSVMRAIRTAVDGLTLDKNPPGDKSLNVSRLFEQIHWPWEPLGASIDSDTVNKLNETLPGLLDQVIAGENSMYGNPAYTRSVTDPYKEKVIPSPLTGSSYGPPILGSLGFIAASALGAVDPSETFNQLIEVLPIHTEIFNSLFEPITMEDYPTSREYQVARLQQPMDAILLAQTLEKEIAWFDGQGNLTEAMKEYRENIESKYHDLIQLLVDKRHINYKSGDILINEGIDGWRKNYFPAEITDYTAQVDEDNNRPKRKVNNPEELLQYTFEQHKEVVRAKTRYMLKGLPGEDVAIAKLRLFNHFRKKQKQPLFDSWEDVMKVANGFINDPEASSTPENIAFMEKIREVNEAVSNYYSPNPTKIQNLNGALDGYFNSNTANSDYLKNFMNGEIYGPTQESNPRADALSYAIEDELNTEFTKHHNKIGGDTDDHTIPFISKSGDPGGYNVPWDRLSPESRIAALRTFSDFEKKYGIELNTLKPAITMYARGLDNLSLLFNPEEFNRDDQSRMDGIAAAFLITDLGVLADNKNLPARQAFFDRLGIKDKNQILLLAFVGEAKDAGVLTYSLGVGLLENPESIKPLMEKANQTMENIANLMAANAISLNEGAAKEIAKAFRVIRFDHANPEDYIKPAEDLLIEYGWQDLKTLKANELWETYEGMLTSLGIEIAANEKTNFEVKSTDNQKIEILSVISLMINNPLIDPETVQILMQLPRLGGGASGSKVGKSLISLASYYGPANLVRDDNKIALYRSVNGSLNTAPREIVNSLNRVAVPPTATLAETVGPPGADNIETTISTAIQHNTPWFSDKYSDFTTDRVGVDTVSNKNWWSRNVGGLLGGSEDVGTYSYTERRPERVIRFLESHVNSDKIGILNESTGERSLRDIATISGIDVRVSDEELSRGITPLTKLAEEVSRRARNTETALQKIEDSRIATDREADEAMRPFLFAKQLMGHGPRNVGIAPGTRRTDDSTVSRDVRELMMTDVLFTYLHLLEGEVEMKGKRFGPDSPDRAAVEFEGITGGKKYPAGSLVAQSGVVFGSNLKEGPRRNLPETIYSEPTDTEISANYIGTYNVDLNPFYFINDPSTRGSVAIQVNTKTGKELFGVSHLNIPLNQINGKHPQEMPSRRVGLGGWTMGLGYNNGMLFDHASNNNTRDYTHQDFGVKWNNANPAAISNNPYRVWSPPRYMIRKRVSEQDLFYREMSRPEQIRHYDQTE